MLRLEFKFKRPHITGWMVREDVVDFVAKVQEVFPGTVFFNERDRDNRNFEVYASPFDYLESRKRSDLTLRFRSPTKKELKDGRPEVLSGFSSIKPWNWTKADYRAEGRCGGINHFMVPPFAEAVIPAFTTEEFQRLRRITGRKSQYRHFDSEDSRYYWAQPDFGKSLRVFDGDSRPGLKFFHALDNREMIDYIKTIKRIWFSLLVKSYCHRDLNTGEMIKIERLRDGGISKRIMDACALDDNLFVTIGHSDRGANAGIDPTDEYRDKVRKQAKLAR
jgi:hypothetical protein